MDVLGRIEALTARLARENRCLLALLTAGYTWAQAEALLARTPAPASPPRRPSVRRAPARPGRVTL